MLLLRGLEWLLERRELPSLVSMMAAPALVEVMKAYPSYRDERQKVAGAAAVLAALLVYDGLGPRCCGTKQSMRMLTDVTGLTSFLPPRAVPQVLESRGWAGLALVLAVTFIDEGAARAEAPQAVAKDAAGEAARSSSISSMVRRRVAP